MKHVWKNYGIVLDTNPPMMAWCEICGETRSERDICSGDYINGNNTEEECPGKEIQRMEDQRDE